VNIYERKRRHHVFAERLLMSKTDRVIVSANSVRDFYVEQIHADSGKIDVLYNAVDFKSSQPSMPRDAMRASLGVPANARVAGMIARLTEQKGHRYLFQALTTPALGNVHLIVVGDGELREALTAEVQDLGIAPACTFSARAATSAISSPPWTSS
jgi:glycosyltransferase involved in cell wall biosynthesis